ncbi:MAG: hypothetical protein JNK82_39740 [Myxococcaceae bacterium]|nr:hypothetical protein [Myxococcaceae bacterium]
MNVEEQLERALAALKACDPIEAARILDEPPSGPATVRARVLWQQCIDAMPAVLAEWQKRSQALNAVRAYTVIGP